ncbi:hypothetical protein [Actinokineospora terrae]|uniref:Uncharacterized protein n=1 Tax=Actinokineospora terrae TaxID=155974 RepID=A0A1H9VG62_9PSEU|nr:hypothetical protein [Actinokineospora terrae]SES20756.1 hypothetical protein SAMN04487818_108349 [Actinokineospora terrae]
MTPDEHYRLAERLMESRVIRQGPWADLPSEKAPPLPDAVARAQVHATLALIGTLRVLEGEPDDRQ